MGQEAETVSRALVPVVPAASDPVRCCAGARPSADFIAHLAAMRAQAPQTRTRRRAEPPEAIAAYGALARWPSRTGAMVSRSL
jgi:hypothetical protein